MPTNPISTSLVVYQTVNQHFQSTTALDGMYIGNIHTEEADIEQEPNLEHPASETVQHTPPSVEHLLDGLKDHLFRFVLKSR